MRDPAKPDHDVVPTFAGAAARPLVAIRFGGGFLRGPLTRSLSSWPARYARIALAFLAALRPPVDAIRADFRLRRLSSRCPHPRRCGAEAQLGQPFPERATIGFRRVPIVGENY